MDALRFHAFVVTLALSAARFSHHPSAVSMLAPINPGDKIERRADPLLFGINGVARNNDQSKRFSATPTTNAELVVKMAATDIEPKFSSMRT